MKIFIEDDEDNIDIYNENIIKLEEVRLKNDEKFLNDFVEKQKKEYLEEIKKTNIFDDVKKIKKKNNSFLSKIKKTFGI